MKTVLTFFFLFLFISNAFSQLAGNYSKRGKDFKYTLVLHTDSSFSFTKEYFEVISKCEGKWKKLSDKFLLLSCGETTLAEKLQEGYMNQRETTVQLFKNNKLKIGKVLLQKS
jgi:hypothetical protein